MEKSIEYNLLGTINYKSNKYNIYRDDKNRKFYLRIIEDTDDLMDLSYPTLEEFKELNEIFGMNSIKKEIPFIKRDKNKENKETKLSKSKKIRFTPKVLKETGVAISLAAAIFLSGAANDNVKRDKYIDYKTFTSQGYKVDIGYKNFIQQMTDEEMLTFYEYPVKKVEDDIYASKEITFGYTTYSLCTDVVEFREHIGLKEAPTYKNLIDAVENNKNITGDYEVWLKKGINNLFQNKEFHDVDFSVLLYNIQNLTIQEDTSEEITEKIGVPYITGYFDYMNQKTVLNLDYINSDVFIHETIGHGSAFAYADGKIFLPYASIVVLDRLDDGYMNNISKVYCGRALEEGKAELLTKIALTPEEIVYVTYDTEETSIRIIKEILGLTWAEIINNPMALKIISKMEELGMKDSSKYIDNFDMMASFNIVEEVENIDDNIRFMNNMGNLLKDYAKREIETGRSIEDVSKQISQIIQELPVYPNEIGLTTLSQPDVTNIKEFEEYVINSIKRIEYEKMFEEIEEEIVEEEKER